MTTQPMVSTRSGSVRGISTGTVAVFKGIPYAQPPVGARRFAPPQPAVPWDGIRDATVYGPTAPKAPYVPPYDQLVPEAGTPGDDYLNLNIWTPDPAGSGLPVMVFIHGGAFTNGSGAVPAYDGSRFARDGVVCVTLNYRLGADGFLVLGDNPANLGLLDQIAALTWVSENIASFGGDPGNVTVFGESAGAMSIAVLLAMDAARGLFRRAILESGAGHHALTPGTARLIGTRLAEKLGVEPTLAGIADVPVDRVTRAQQELRAEIVARPDPALWGQAALNQVPFLPVIDGETLTALPAERIAAGAGAGVDILIGHNTDEFRFYLVPTGAIDLVEEWQLRRSAAAYGLLVDEALAVYRAGRPGATPGDLLAAVTTDWFFAIPALRLAEAHAACGAARTYLYEFAWQSPAFDGRIGACHVAELGFVFDNLHDKGLAPLIGERPPQQLADTMHAAWVAFATSGDPGWAGYGADHRTVMRFDTVSRTVTDPRPMERALWEGLR
ncbi:carboxylesterase family protein [Streptomyces sp. RB6PN25]|uniref:Carboxylic ester hydrolase n=1 Tax=Streptomyces humicola TaxID=2953240 RepID=A0ABT1PPL7_9ACTN|nr:carboxylesterase family protein [Streptomyces humicola]MCQ4079618.1 carboxylesterase family protein [Streptomyces humicola]